MSQPNQNNNNPDRYKYTKIFVGGLTWRTTSNDLRRFFGQFGETLDANVVYETYPPGRSKGYGFVIFKEAESAAEVCKNEHYVIDGREANVNLAHLRAKNKTNQSNQNGLLNQAIPFNHQSQPIHHPYFSPPPPYWGPYYYGQYYPQMYQQAIHHHYPTPMQHNWNQMDNQPHVISMPQSPYVCIPAPPSRLPRLESLDEANGEEEEEEVNETVTTLESDQEGESVGIDNVIDDEVTVYQDERVHEEAASQENGVDHEENGENISIESEINGGEEEEEEEED